MGPSDSLLASSQRLRVGLYVDSLALPRWACRMIRSVQRDAAAEIVLVVKNRSPGGPPGRRSIADRRPAYSAYRRLDRALFRIDDDALAREDAAGLLAGASTLEVEPRKTTFSDYLSDDDCERIRQFKLDVMIRLGFRILRGRALEVARYGVWSHHGADSEVNRGAPPGFWEVFLGWPATGCVLQVLSEELDAGKVIERRMLPTDRYSERRNLNAILWEMSELAPHRLRELARRGPAALDDFTEPDAYRPYDDVLFRAPRASAVVRGLAGLGAKCLADLAGRLLFRPEWFTALLPTRRPGLADSFHRARPMQSPRSVFWADPFVVADGQRTYVFLEEFPYATQKGHIAVTEVDADGRWTTPRTVLETDYHLAYPFTFEYRGKRYLLPTSPASRAIDLYEEVEFPWSWRHAHRLMDDVWLIDGTLYEHEGRWWLFGSQTSPSGCNDIELCLFHSESPFGRWTPHPGNPVKGDVRSARPAGALFRRGKRLYRPAQNCSIRYGYAMTINEVLELTPSSFVERPVAEIFPTWRTRLLGTHTLNTAGNLTVIDGYRNRWRWWGQ